MECIHFCFVCEIWSFYSYVGTWTPNYLHCDFDLWALIFVTGISLSFFSTLVVPIRRGSSSFGCWSLPLLNKIAFVAISRSILFCPLWFSWCRNSFTGCPIQLSLFMLEPSLTCLVPLGVDFRVVFGCPIHFQVPPKCFQAWKFTSLLVSKCFANFACEDSNVTEFPLRRGVGVQRCWCLRCTPLSMCCCLLCLHLFLFWIVI